MALCSITTSRKQCDGAFTQIIQGHYPTHVIADGMRMIKNPAVAKQVSELMLDVFRRLDESTHMVKETCSPEEFSAYNKAVARVVGPIVMDVLKPLYVDN